MLKDSRDIIRRLQQDGFALVSVRGLIINTGTLTA